MSSHTLVMQVYDTAVQKLQDALFRYSYIWHVIFLVLEEVCKMFAEGLEFHRYLV